MTATFIGVTPKDCPLCSNKLTPQKTKLINIGNEKFLKHFLYGLIIIIIVISKIIIFSGDLK